MNTPAAATTAPRLLTVCLGNICRSPTAEAALREAARRAGVAVTVASAGTGTWHVGNPPDTRMTAAAARVGLTLAGVAQRVDATLLQRADLVLAMDADNLRELQRLAHGAGITTPIRRFRAFDSEADGDLDTPDPYYGGTSGFDTVVAICRRGAASIATQLAAGVAVEDLQGWDDPLVGG